MLLLNQITNLPMAGLLPKWLDFGIEKLKAGSQVRLGKFPLLPFAAPAMTMTLALHGGFFSNCIFSFLCYGCVSFPNLSEKLSHHLSRPL